MACVGKAVGCEVRLIQIWGSRVGTHVGERARRAVKGILTRCSVIPTSVRDEVVPTIVYYGLIYAPSPHKLPPFAQNRFSRSNLHKIGSRALNPRKDP